MNRLVSVSARTAREGPHARALAPGVSVGDGDECAASVSPVITGAAEHKSSDDSQCCTTDATRREARLAAAARRAD